MTAPRESFERHLARFERIKVARYLYGRATVPPQAVGVVLRLGDRWWYVTPGFPQDRSAWRVSQGDQHGPSGHETSDWAGRPYESKYIAIADVLGSQPRARITDYVLPSGKHVELGVRRNPRHRWPRLHGGRA